ncbi:hypothetical protein [Vibrio paucivorans]|nr:hypothetical protein [Vibrio paucivorans]
MGHDLGNVYVGHLMAKRMMEDSLYGKAAPKKVSLFKRLKKKMNK